MNNRCKKIIVAMSMLTYLGTVQAMTMMPVGFHGSHCQEPHKLVASLQAEGSFLAEDSLTEGSSNQAKDVFYDSNHCMACFAIADEETDSLNHLQPVADSQGVINAFCSVALTILSPPPKSMSSY